MARSRAINLRISRRATTMLGSRSSNPRTAARNVCGPGCWRLGRAERPKGRLAAEMLQRGAILVLGSLRDGVVALVPASSTTDHANRQRYSLRLFPNNLPIAHGS